MYLTIEIHYFSILSLNTLCLFIYSYFVILSSNYLQICFTTPRHICFLIHFPLSSRYNFLRNFLIYNCLTLLLFTQYQTPLTTKKVPGYSLSGHHPHSTLVLLSILPFISNPTRLPTGTYGTILKLENKIFVLDNFRRLFSSLY